MAKKNNKMNQKNKNEFAEDFAAKSTNQAARNNTAKAKEEKY